MQNVSVDDKLSWWQKSIRFILPQKAKRPLKIDLVFVIFFGIIVWRVALNLFTNAGFIPWNWSDYHFWFNNILANMLALFGLVWIFRIYVKSLKGINPVAEDILKTIKDKVPGAKDNPAFKELQRKYNIQ